MARDNDLAGAPGSRPGGRAGGVQIHPVTSLSRAEAQAVVRIFHAAFPVEQRIEDAALMQLIPQPHEEPGGHSFHVAMGRGGVCGFAAGLHVTSIGLAYIAYLAVEGVWRGQGIGTALFRSLVERWAATYPRPPHWVFLEVERPELARDATARDFCRRRIGLYERLGLTRIEADFQAPPLGPELPVVPYWIYMLPMREPDLRHDAIEHALTNLYREVYGLPAGHPLVVHCLKSMRGA
jgi:GNAT superfamily N-acetyltransferase